MKNKVFIFAAVSLMVLNALAVNTAKCPQGFEVQLAEFKKLVPGELEESLRAVIENPTRGTDFKTKDSYERLGAPGLTELSVQLRLQHKVDSMCDYEVVGSTSDFTSARIQGTDAKTELKIWSNYYTRAAVGTKIQQSFYYRYYIPIKLGTDKSITRDASVPVHIYTIRDRCDWGDCVQGEGRIGSVGTTTINATTP